MQLLKDLGIEPGVLLINVIGFLCLLWFMKRFAFGPIKQILGERQDRVTGQLSEAKALHEQAEAERERLHDELEAEREAARSDIGKLTQEAKQAIEELHREGRRQRQEMIEQGRAELQRSKEAALAELRATVSELALEISTRVIREALDEERQGALLDQFVEDVKRAGQRGELS
jgi:F-type H+-transporting ATPase subunit b